MDPLEEPLDWTLPLPPQPVNPTDLEGAGAICETKRFDSFYNTSGDRVVLPAGKKYTSKTARAYKSAMTVTNYWDKNQDLERTELEIKSPFMKEALKAVVPGYATFNIHVKNISITGDPHCLFHYREELMDYGRVTWEGHNVEAGRHIQHLIAYMWEVFAVEIISFNALEWLQDFEPSLEHKYLWMIFKPGDVIYVRNSGPRAFRLERMTNSENKWTLHGVVINYNGDEFGFSGTTETIDYYEGLKPLKDLSVITFDRLSADERRNEKEKLIARGRKFLGIHGKRYLWYRPGPDKSSLWIESRIMADYEGFCDVGPGYRRRLEADKKKYKPKDALDHLTEEELMICHNYIPGYSLRENVWGAFDIDAILDIAFDSAAFDDLILPDYQKKQLLALVRAHENDDYSFDDLIKGKGKGMTFLLYGEPGLGKTLTAESVADYCQKPLLRLDAGTLGTSASSVEGGLRDAFRLAERWNALLLLDEADVYLEQRRSRNMTHNGIVSVFLRMLEYYHGILFLTTNRISAFDTAFVSRIHLAIHYPPLTRSSRRALLYTFIKQMSEASAEELSLDGSLKRIAKEKLNGRQIKNIVRAACALAQGDSDAGGNIRRRHLEIALRPMKLFTQTMERVRLSEEEQPSSKREELEEEEQEDQVDANGEESSDEIDDDEDEDGLNDEVDNEESEDSESEIDLTGDQIEEAGQDIESDDDDENDGIGNTEPQQKRRRLV